MDPDNPVIKLCVEGIQTEMQGRSGEALELYMQAWEARQDDFDACIAAHYVARMQTDAGDILRWNREAIERADAVSDDRVQGFYPSLYLNMGWAYELLGDMNEAKENYQLAAEKLADLPADAYTDVVRQGVASALERFA